jgi:hypothetical protein
MNKGGFLHITGIPRMSLVEVVMRLKQRKNVIANLPYEIYRRWRKKLDYEIITTLFNHLHIAHPKSTGCCWQH